jgi:drug/metabolite transporter (DMT)-like permease
MSRALLQIHFCVFLWGFTAIFGRLIALPATQLVLWRMLLVAALLLPLPRVRHTLRALPGREIAIFAGIGLVVAAHWLAFYASVKLANASVAAVTLAVAPALTAVLEPWLTEARFRPADLLLALATVPGMALVFGGIGADMTAGILMGLLSAALAALFIALNKRHVGQRDALAITALEVGAGAIAVCILVALLGPLQAPSVGDWIGLGMLATFCTIVPFALSLVALRELPAFTAQLAVNLEPLYTMAFAALLFGETRELDLPFYLGAAMLIGSVFVYTALTAGRRASSSSANAAAGTGLEIK